MDGMREETEGGAHSRAAVIREECVSLAATLMFVWDMCVWLVSGCFFFFQAEDGIRDYKVTGVQTCALPILTREALSAALGETPTVDPELERWLRELWARRGMPFPDLNLKQAWLIPSAAALDRKSVV